MNTGSRQLGSVFWQAQGLAAHLLADHRYRKAAVVLAALGAAAFLGPRSSPLLVAGLYGGLAAMLLVRWPHLGLPGLVVAAAFVPFEIGTGTGSSVNVALIGLAGLTVLWAGDMAVRRAPGLRPSRANAPWIALVLVAGISIVAGSALWNPWVVTKDSFVFVQAAQLAVFALSACAFWLAGHTPRHRRDLETLAWLLLALGALFVVAHLPGLGALRSRLLIGGVVFRVWVVSLAAALALFHTGLPRALRAALLALAVAVPAVAYLQGPGWQSGWLPPLVTLAAVTAVRLGRGFTRLAALFAAPMLVAFATVVLPSVARLEAWSFDTRIIAWRGLLELMPGRWLLGLGLGSYWHYYRGVLGRMEYLDPETGYLHYTYEPQVNMHNNFFDVFGQMGLLGLAALVWLVIALFVEIRHGYTAERSGFGRAYMAAAAGALAGMLFAAMLADWVFPFVYNIGLTGFRDSYLGWLMLGGIVLLRWTRSDQEGAACSGGAP